MPEFIRIAPSGDPRPKLKPIHINQFADAFDSIPDPETLASLETVTQPLANPGTDGQVLTVVSGESAWSDPAPAGFGQRFDVREYGAVLDGVTDDLNAFQDAATDAVANNGHVWFDGHAAINGPIEIAGSTITGFGLFGSSRGGSQLTQLADNTPMILPNLTTQAHSWGIGNFTATWDNTQDSSDTASDLIRLDHTSGNFYNSWLGNITLTNCYRFINTDGQLFWGNEISNVQATSIYGGFYRLNGSAGQPNNLMSQVYLGAQNCTQPLFLGNALVMNVLASEVNQVSNGVQVLTDSGGGDYSFLGEFSVEGGAWGSNVELFAVPDSILRMQELKIEGTATARVRVFVTQGSGMVDVDLLRIGIAPSASGNVFFWHTGGTISDPSAYMSNGRVNLGKVRFYGSLSGYSRTTNYVTPNDMGSTAASDGGQIDEWMDPTRIDYAGNAAYTLGVGAPAKIIYNTALTANRDVTLPHTDYLFSGYKVTVAKNVTGGDVVVKTSGGTTLYTLANATKGFIEVTYNRSIGDGPSLGWSITGGGTWT